VGDRWYVYLHGAYENLTLLADWQLLPKLENGVAVGGLSGAAGGHRNWRFVVPAGAGGLTFTLRPEAGSTGDANLFVRRGEHPTSDLYDGRSRRVGNTENISLPASAGTWYVMVVGRQAYDHVKLKASFVPPP
jgi:serine protease